MLTRQVSIPLSERERLQQSILRAEVDRDTWRTAGLQEKYLEAYSRVEALECELEGLDALTQLPVNEPGPAITFDGRQWCLGPYRYDRLADADRYADLLRARPGGMEELDAPQPPRAIREPGALERETMRGLAITFEAGTYRLGPYRYDRLADAVAYASHPRLDPHSAG